MYSAIIFIKNDKEFELAKTTLLGKKLIEYTLFELKKLDLDNIFLIGGKDLILDGIKKRDNIEEIVNDLSKVRGKTLLLSPLYPLTTKNDYLGMLNNENEDGVVMLDENGLCKVFMLDNSQLVEFDDIDFKEFKVEESSGIEVTDFSDIPTITKELQLRINYKLIEKGVNIVDPENTYISQDATIDKDTIIYPQTVIEGKCSIGKNNIIEGSTYLNSVVIGNNNHIMSSRIVESVIHDDVSVGPNAHIRTASEIFNNTRIGNYVEIKNSDIGANTKVAHLAYVGDAKVGEYVNIGCGAITINYDGTKKSPTVIKDHAFIGSNANLIAPITIGEYAVVAAGSTVDADVQDGDMAISRLYQTNKKGYGYKYINKEN